MEENKEKEIELTPEMEILEERTEYAKVYDLGEGRRRMIVSKEKIHIQENGKLVDITCNIKGRKVIRCPYNARILKNKIGYYAENKNKIIEMEIIDVPVSEPIIENNTAKWKNVTPGVDIILTFTPNQIRFFRIIKNKKARKTFNYRIVMDEKMIEHVSFDGLDASNKKIHLEQKEISCDTIKRKGLKLSEKIISDTFLNEITEMDETTRKRYWSKNVSFPVTIC